MRDLAGTETERDAVSPMVRALVAEVGKLLTDYLGTGKAGQVDLLRMPIAPNDIVALKDTLGRGEITISMDVMGQSELSETSIAGVWWIEHRDETGRIVARLIEVAEVPGIVPASRQDMQEAAVALLRETAGN